MDGFIYCATSISSRKLRNYSSSEIEAEERNLKIWKDSRNKHEVDDFYEEPLFGIIYVKNLYRCRVLSFYEVLKDASTVEQVKHQMSKLSNIVSIGCGPGPEIAAYVSYVRTYCSNRSHLNIRGLDTISHWEDFVIGSESCDRNISVTFQNVFVDSNFISRCALSGVCLMSYPEAVNFDTRFWSNLQAKFDLVIIIDQSKAALHNKLTMTNYTIRSLEYKGTKHYAVHVGSQRSHLVSSTRQPSGLYSNTCAYKSIPRVPSYTYSQSPSTSSTNSRSYNTVKEEGFIEKYCTIL